MNRLKSEYWKHKSLDQMSLVEWEGLCDGCGKCCLHKIEDEDTDIVHYTQVSCRYLGAHCNCTQYEDRKDLVPGCIKLKPDDLKNYHWLPRTCAYRLIAEGKALQHWHPLISGSKETVHAAGVSVKERVISEEFVHPEDIESYVISWVD